MKLGLLGAAAAVLLAVVLSAPAHAASSVDMTARLNGVDVGKPTETHPIRLDPKEPATLELTITNNGDQAITVRTVRIDGRVLGLTFFAYDTTINTKVDAHQTEARSYALDLTGLDGQATGLIPSRVELLDSGRHVIADRSGVIDVRGSLKSVYGFFGFAVLLVTAVSIAGSLLALARGRLHPNRWRRALRFLAAGVGVGLVLVFSLSAFRAFAPLPSRWIPCVLGASVLFFVIGYLTPTPDTGDDDDDDLDLSNGSTSGSHAEPVLVGAAPAPAPVPAPQTVMPGAPATLAPSESAPPAEHA